MRKIEKEMLQAIMYGENFRKDNTEVDVVPEGSSEKFNIYLHGNHIATAYRVGRMLEVDTNRETLASWPTVTTKSRLRALGVDLTQSKGRIFIDGEFVCEA